MKLFSFLFLCGFLLIAGCSSDIGLVKEHFIDEIDDTITIGKALDNYKYFENITWKQFEVDGRNIVQVNCRFSKDYVNSITQVISNSVGNDRKKAIVKIDKYYDDIEYLDFVAQFFVPSEDRIKFKCSRFEYKHKNDSNSSAIDSWLPVEDTYGAETTVYDLVTVYKNEQLLPALKENFRIFFFPAYKEDIIRKMANEAKSNLNIIVTLENQYFNKNDTYSEFEPDQDCPSIDFKAKENKYFIYSFKDLGNGNGIAYAYERNDINGDGDVEDGLALTTDKQQMNIKDKELLDGSYLW